MKIRTDFVTNSSSSSFVTIRITAKDGSIFDLDMGDAYVDEDCLPVVTENTLMSENYNDTAAISTLEDLFGCIFFAQSEEPLPLVVSSTVFAFLIKKLTPSQFRNKIKKVEGFEQLEDIDPEDYEDNEEFRDGLLEVLPEYLEELGCYVDLCDDSVFEEYKTLLKKIGNLSNIQKIDFNLGENLWGEGLGIYCDAVNRALAKKELVALSADDPAYQKEFHAWLTILKEEILPEGMSMYVDLESLVEKTLLSGNPMALLPDQITKNQCISLEIPQ